MANEADKTNISMWTLFMASSVRAALHMDPSYNENFEVFKNSDLRFDLRAIRDYASKFKDGHCAFLLPGEENKWYHDYESNHEGKWDLRDSKIVDEFEKSGHPVFEGTSPLGWGIFKRKKGKDTIHFNGKHSNIDLLYRTVHSANQLCVHGAVTNWCETLGRVVFEKRENCGHDLDRRLLNEERTNAEEIDSLVTVSRIPPAPRNRMRQRFQDFESFAPESQLKHVPERAGFYHPGERKKVLQDSSWRWRWMEKYHFHV